MPPAQAKEVVVVAGDTLEAIAHTYAVSLEALIPRIGIQDPSRLHIGQKLLLPNPPMGGSSPAQPDSKGSEAIAPPLEMVQRHGGRLGWISAATPWRGQPFRWRRCPRSQCNPPG